MIKKIIAYAIVDHEAHYNVQWNKKGNPNSWTTIKECPQISAFLEKQSNQRALVEVSESHPYVEYLKWRKQRKSDDKEGQVQEMKAKLHAEGTPRYDAAMIQRLQRQWQKYDKECQKTQPEYTRLDYLIQNVEGIVRDKEGKLVFAVSVIGKASRYIIPFKKMKRHFPQTLRDYLTDVIEVHKAKDYHEQAEARVQALQKEEKAQGKSKEKKQEKSAKIPKQKLYESLNKLGMIQEDSNWDLDAMKLRKKSMSLEDDDE